MDRIPVPPAALAHIRELDRQGTEIRRQMHEAIGNVVRGMNPRELEEGYRWLFDVPAGLLVKEKIAAPPAPKGSQRPASPSK